VQCSALDVQDFFENSNVRKKPGRSIEGFNGIELKALLNPNKAHEGEEKETLN
jgi:hypothetical protein